MKTLINIRTVLLATVAGCALPLAAQDAFKVADLPFTISEHVMVLDAQNDRLILFGGFQDGVLSNQVLAYSFADDTWRKLKTLGVAPSPRREAAAAYDSKRNQLIVFGGESASGYTNDIFALNLNSDGEFWTELGLDALDAGGVRPAPRTQASLVYDQLNDRVILYSGYAAPATLHDVWAFNMNEREQNWGKGALPTVNIPGGTSVGNAAIYDPIGQRMLVYRGHTGGLHALSLDDQLAWTTLTDPSTPSARRYPAVAYDPIRHAMILQGGFLGGYSATSETFMLDINNMNWMQLAVEDKSNDRFWHTGAYDVRRDRLVVVGGRDGARVLHPTMAVLQGEVGIPVPLAPINMDIVTGDVVSLAFEPAIGCINYSVELLRYDRESVVDESALIEIQGNTATAVLSLVKPQNTMVELNYMWRVVGYSALGDAGQFSEYAFFIRQVPPAEAVIGPSNGTSDDLVTDPSLGTADPSLSGPLVDGTMPALQTADGEVATVQDESTGLTFLAAPAATPADGQDEAAGCAGSKAADGLALSLLALLGLAAALRIKRKGQRA